MQTIDLSDFDTDNPCHIKGAPFESTVLDEEGKYQEGYERGRKWAGKGQFYQAGGPYDPTESQTSVKSCQHYMQYRQFCRLNRLAWLRGWADGQASAWEWKDA